MRTILAATVAALFIATTTSAGFAQTERATLQIGPLPGGELLQVLQGHTLTTVSNTRQPYTITFHPGGTIYSTSVKVEDLRTPIADDGTWSLTANNQVCVRWAHWPVPEKCFGLVRDPAGKYWMSDGRPVSIQ